MKRKYNFTKLTIFLLIFICSLSSFFSIKISDYNKPFALIESSDPVLYFPKDFLWGTASASYQLEGGNFNSSWWEFEQTGSNINNSDSAKFAADGFDRYLEDINLLKELNVNSYRFSIEWSRIEPEKGSFDQVSMDHYKTLVGELNKAGIKPMVTLWHFSLPIWFENDGGWENPNSADNFDAYVSYVVSNLAQDTELWVTINEPEAYISGGYLMAKWPPAEKSYSKAKIVLDNLVLAHKKAYSTIHKLDDDAQVGFSQYTSFVAPQSQKNFFENFGAFGMSELSNFLFINKVKNDLDFLGIHYYFRQNVSLKIIKDSLTKDPETLENTSLSRDYYPQGLYQILMKMKKYNLPVYITEIGVQDSHPVNRDEFIEAHVKMMNYAIRDGVDLRGMYYWTFIDCFEWSEGYTPKFGLYSFDPVTFERIRKPDGLIFSNIAKCNCVSN